MSSNLRLLFDECCSRRLRNELKSFYRLDYPALEMRHVLDDYSPATGDSVWLEPLREQTDWIVITKDMGRDRAKERLPFLCKAWGITHVAMTSALIKAGYTEQKNALVAVWPQLFLLWKLPPGTCVKLGFNDVGQAVRQYALRIGQKTLSSALNSTV